MTEIDLESLSTNEQGYTVDDETTMIPFSLIVMAIPSTRGASDTPTTSGCRALTTSW
jgi:hypothetical protein